MNSDEEITRGHFACTARAANRLRRAWRLAAVALALGLAVLGGGVWLVRHRGATIAAADVPAIDVRPLDPAAARVALEARAAVLAQPASGPHWGRLGSVLWALDLIGDASRCYAQAEQLDPREVRWPYLCGLTLESQDPDAALQCLRRAVRIRPELALPKVVLAELLLTRGELSEAEQHLRAAVALVPLDSRVLLGLGRWAFLAGRLPEAEQWTTQAARVDPMRRSIHQLLCQIYARQGDQTKADLELGVLATLTAPAVYYEWPDPFLGEVAQYKRDSLSILQTAGKLIDDGHVAEAIARLQEAGGVQADDVRIAIMLGKAYLQARDLRRAADTLERARGRDPGQAPVHFELGNLARAEGRLGDAATHYEEATRLEPNYALAYYHLGLCRWELKDRDAAIAAIEQTCRCVPQSARVRRSLAQILWESGRREEALKHLEQAVRLAPNDPETRRLQGQMRQP